MPSDASIYSMIKQPQEQMPLQTAAQAMQIRGLMNQNALSGIQQQQAGLQLDEQQRLRQLFQNNPNPSVGDVMGASPTAGMNYQKFQMEKQLNQAKLTTEQQTALINATKMHRDDLANVNNPQQAVAWMTAGYQDPVLGPVFSKAKPLDAAIASIPTDPAQFQAWKQQYALGATKFMELNKPSIHVQNTGAQSNVVAVPGLGGAPTTISSTPMQMTPGENANLGVAQQRLGVERAKLGISAATADPFGMLGIKQMADKAGAGAPAAPGIPTTQAGQATTVSQGVPQIIAPPPGVKNAAPIQSGDWQSIMGTDMHGPEFLAKIPPGLSSQVKAYADGRMQFPAGFALKSPYFQTLLQMVGQYDPSFDAVNYNARSNMRKSLASTASGTIGGNLTKINTAIGHLNSFNDAAQSLNNTDYPLLNKALNAVLPQAGDTDLAGRLRKFQQAKEAVSNELMNVFRGTGASSSDTAKWSQTLNEADSPKALHEAVQGAVDLLNSRIEAIKQTYQNGMGTTEDPLMMVYPKAAATLAKLGSGGTGGSTTTAPTASPIHTDQLPDPAKYSGKTMTDNQSGTKYVSNGKRWVRQGAASSGASGSY